jgi:hypothetical protein
MKISVLLILFMSVFLSANAQSTNDPRASKTASVTVTLAGVSGPSIRIQQIKDQPIVLIADGKKQVTSFDFAWVVKNESGTTEYIGPYHIAGNKLSDPAFASMLKAADKGFVNRVYIDGVYLLNADGTSSKTECGSSYRVIQ